METTDRVFGRLEEAALAALEDFMAYHMYQGSSGRYKERARMGLPVIATYGRVRGTRANERALTLMERRYASGEMAPSTPPALAEQSSQEDAGNRTNINLSDPQPSKKVARVPRRKSV